MTLQLIDVLTIEAVERFTFSEVAKLCELSHEETQELIDYGAIRSDDSEGSECFYSSQKLSVLQIACKQRRDYDLDLFSVVICVQYLENIADLKRQIELLQAVRRP
jgi:MerR HTH family regulatory protein